MGYKLNVFTSNLDLVGSTTVDFNKVVTTHNEAIGGSSLTNAFGKSQDFVSTVVVDNDGNLVITE